MTQTVNKSRPTRIITTKGRVLEDFPTRQEAEDYLTSKGVEPIFNENLNEVVVTGYKPTTVVPTVVKQDINNLKDAALKTAPVRYSLRSKLEDLYTIGKAGYTYLTTPTDIAHDPIKAAAEVALNSMSPKKRKELLRAAMEQSKGSDVITPNMLVDIAKAYYGNMTGRKVQPKYTGSNKEGRNLVSLYLDKNESGFENVTNNDRYKEGADYAKYIQENYPELVDKIQTYKGIADGDTIQIPIEEVQKGLNKITESTEYAGFTAKDGTMDNVGHTLRMIKQNPDGSYYTIDSDIWDFNPKDWIGRWEGDQNVLLDKAGTPFILKSIHPINVMDNTFDKVKRKSLK